MKKLIILFSITAILISCKSDDTNLQNFQLNSDTLSVIPYQLVKVSSNTIDFSQEEYLADFGSNQIPLAKNEAGDLIFLVPDIPPGDHEFVLTVDGRKGVLSFYVGNNNPDIETSVFENAIETFTFFKNYSTGLISTYNLTQQTVDRLNASNEMISDLIDRYNSSSTLEKTQIAKFLNANKIFNQNYYQKQPLSQNASGENLPFIVNALRLLNLSEVFYSWNELITPAIVQSQTLVPDDIIRVFTVVGIYSFSSHIEASIEMLRDISYYPVSVSIYDENNNANNFNFQNTMFTSFNLKLGERRLISDDRNSPDNYIADLVTQIDFIIANWEDFKVINPTVISSSNWFSEWLSSGSNYMSVSSDLPPLRQSDIVIDNTGKSENMTLEGIPNDIEYEVQITGDYIFNLRFTATQTNLPLTFQFSVNYQIAPMKKMSNEIYSTLQ
jgi:hypothetical protein